jgi:hypothetical protein
VESAAAVVAAIDINLLNPKTTMFIKLRPSAKSRILTSRLSSLILLFQRSPLVQMLFPEARIIGSAGLGEITKWSVATIAGLGVFDSVAGATSIGQISPASGSVNVTTALDSDLNFNFSILGSSHTPASWTVITAPPGTLINAAAGKNSKLTGRPTQAGTFSKVAIRCWEGSNGTGRFAERIFTITVGSAIITTHPNSTSISTGTTTTLSVVGSGTPLTYQWFQGSSINTATLISGATSASFTTPSLTTATSYFARVTRGTNTTTTNTVTSNSNIATVSIQTATPASITTGPSSATIDSGASTTLSVTASGTAPLTYQWYQGTSGITTIPVGLNQATFTPNPALDATTNYWVKVSNSANVAGANSGTATITVREPFETWRNSQFSPSELANSLISGPTADPDGDGVGNDNEYIFGTPPLSRSPSSSPTLTVGGGQVSVNFTARSASGSGYFGKTRYYTLQFSSELGTATWSDVSNFKDLVGANQVVNFSAPTSPTKQFYRLKVLLTP